MEIIPKPEFTRYFLEHVFCNFVKIEDHVKISTSFKLQIDEENISMIKIELVVEMFSENDEKFGKVVVVGIFDTNNKTDNLEINEISNIKELADPIYKKTSEIIGFITENCYGKPLFFPNEVNSDTLSEILRENK